MLHRLNEIRARPEGSIPGDKLFHFRKRAVALCHKWKPQLLREYQLSPYRWYRLTDSSAVLRYTSPESEGECLIPSLRQTDLIQALTLTTFALFLELEDELWAEVLGQGPLAEKAIQELEGPWQSVRLLDGFFDINAEFRDTLAAAGF